DERLADPRKAGRAGVAHSPDVSGRDRGRPREEVDLIGSVGAVDDGPLRTAPVGDQRIAVVAVDGAPDRPDIRAGDDGQAADSVAAAGLVVAGNDTPLECAGRNGLGSGRRRSEKGRSDSERKQEGAREAASGQIRPRSLSASLCASVVGRRFSFTLNGTVTICAPKRSRE